MDLWEKCVDFHGHSCGGLRIGYAAAEYAMKLLNIGFSDNEQVVCISENDACGVDAIQVMLGCSIGKGNLLFHMTGKQAFSFYNRETGESVRLVLKPKPLDMTPEQGSRVSMRVARGSASLLPSHGRGLWPRDVLKKVSRGLSRVEAGNPGFPRLVQVTSGGFSWWL